MREVPSTTRSGHDAEEFHARTGGASMTGGPYFSLTELAELDPRGIALPVLVAITTVAAIEPIKVCRIELDGFQGIDVFGVRRARSEDLLESAGFISPQVYEERDRLWRHYGYNDGALRCFECGAKASVPGRISSDLDRELWRCARHHRRSIRVVAQQK